MGTSLDRADSSLDYRVTNCRLARLLKFVRMRLIRDHFGTPLNSVFAKHPIAWIRGVRL